MKKFKNLIKKVLNIKDKQKSCKTSYRDMKIISCYQKGTFWIIRKNNCGNIKEKLKESKELSKIYFQSRKWFLMTLNMQ